MFPRASKSPAPSGHRTDNTASGDELADLVSDPHCRHLLHYLRENDERVSVATVSRYVVAQITDTPEDEVPESALRRVQVWFHNGQLPVLADHGLVEFDPESGTVSLATDEREGTEPPTERADG